MTLTLRSKRPVSGACLARAHDACSGRVTPKRQCHCACHVEAWWEQPGALQCPYLDCRKRVTREGADEHLAVCRKRNVERLKEQGRVTKERPDDDAAYPTLEAADDPAEDTDDASS